MGHTLYVVFLFALMQYRIWLALTKNSREAKIRWAWFCFFVKSGHDTEIPNSILVEQLILFIYLRARLHQLAHNTLSIEIGLKSVSTEKQLMSLILLLYAI